jgi:hypothetical protein
MLIDLVLGVLEDVVVLLPWTKKKRERRGEWTGLVEAKKTGALSKHAFLVVFRTDEGKKKKVRLDRKEDFDAYEEGRKYLKRAGHILPDTRPTA